VPQEGIQFAQFEQPRESKWNQSRDQRTVARQATKHVIKPTKMNKTKVSSTNRGPRCKPSN